MERNILKLIEKSVTMMISKLSHVFVQDIWEIHINFCWKITLSRRQTKGGSIIMTNRFWGMWHWSGFMFITKGNTINYSGKTMLGRQCADIATNSSTSAGSHCQNECSTLHVSHLKLNPLQTCKVLLNFCSVYWGWNWHNKPQITTHHHPNFWDVVLWSMVFQRCFLPPSLPWWWKQ